MLQISLKIFGGEGAAVVVGRSWMEEAEGLMCAGASWLEGAEEWVWTAVCEVVVAVLLWVVAGKGVSESWDWLSVVPCSSSPTENENYPSLFIRKKYYINRLKKPSRNKFHR